MRRERCLLGLELERVRLPDEVYYALRWWGYCRRDAMAEAARHNERDELPLRGLADVPRGWLVATNGESAVVVRAGRPRPEEAGWLTLRAGRVVVVRTGGSRGRLPGALGRLRLAAGVGGGESPRARQGANPGESYATGSGRTRWVGWRG